MTKFDKKYHYEYISTYVRGDRRADVFKRQPDGVYGIEMFEGHTMVRREPYKGKSEAWAQSAAENYVDGIKNL